MLHCIIQQKTTECSDCSFLLPVTIVTGILSFHLVAACPTHNQGLQVCTPYGPVPPSLDYYRSGMICAYGMFPASWMHLAPYKPSLSLRVILREDANHLRKPHLFGQLREEWNQTWVRVWDRFKTAQCPTVRRAVINRSNTSTSCFDSISDMHTQTRLAWNTWTTCLNNTKVIQKYAVGWVEKPVNHSECPSFLYML